MSPLPSDRAQQALILALRPLADPFTVIAARSTTWASATFEGARHRLALRLDGDGAGLRAERLRTGLAEAELDIRGGFVADVVVERQSGDAAAPVVAIEALTIAAAG